MRPKGKLQEFQRYGLACAFPILGFRVCRGISGIVSGLSGKCG
jgi:hypothetical protein